MSRFTKHRPSPAMVVALVALFVAMSGGAYAAATIGSAQIKNNSVKSTDVRNGSLLGKDLKSNTLGGKQVKESSLGKVRTAGTADNATNSTNAANAANATNATNAANAGALSGLRVVANRVANVDFDQILNTSRVCRSDDVTVPGVQPGDVVLASPTDGLANDDINDDQLSITANEIPSESTVRVQYCPSPEAATSNNDDEVPYRFVVLR